ncbi:uncharacterized protein LOC109595554 [Aethina tumida]|uniref:uncharacterized protein LOC109595554 n=1 Tax=Aethina tumida TaxID=116153 RepID=UPI00096AF15D|nr:uncharacterized protein LOC109595554 [Aethina tumida]
MLGKFRTAVCFVVIAVGFVAAAPRNLQHEDLTKAFADFLKQDKEFNAALDRPSNLGDAKLTRFRRSSLSDTDLTKAFADFLKHDKQFNSALEKTGEHEQIRVRREAELSVDGMDVMQNGEQPGFFDRAAKFVVELLQRFLKWINTDSN